MSCDHFLGKNSLPWRPQAAFPTPAFSGSEGRENRGVQLPQGATGPLTCVGLHVLQQVVVELELDPAGATGVRFCGEKRSSCVTGRMKPGTPLLSFGQIWNWEPKHTLGLWAQPICPRH